MRSTRLLLFFLFTACQIQVFAQNIDLNITYSKANKAENDTAKVNALNALAKYHQNGYPDSSFYYASQAEKLSLKLNYPKGVIIAHVSLGVLQTDKGNFPEALNILLQASAEAEKLQEYSVLAGTKLNLGNLYIKTGDIAKGLTTYKEGIKICEAHNIFYTQASLYTSYGMGLRLQNNLDSALFYYEKVLEIHNTVLHDSTVIAAIYNNMASVHFQRSDRKTAENYLLKSYEISKLTGNRNTQLLNLGNLVGLVGQEPGGDYEKAKEYFNMAVEMAKEMQAKEALNGIYETMSFVSYNHEKFKDAFDYMMVCNAYRDSVFGADKQAQILEISEQFKTKQIQDSLRIKEQELVLSQTNEEAANLKASKSAWQLVGVIFVLLCILVVLFFVYRNSKNQKRINTLLHEKNDEINHQRLEIQEKNTELTDSINYAKRIQQALLPSSNYLTKVLGDHFLIFKPKDIVSGDFYWVKHFENKVYFAVADCTGHGVPGAMVSMLGYETIDRVANNPPADAAQFINQVNDSLVYSLTGKNTGALSNDLVVKDGMDLSLSIVTDNQKLSYCGANNECYIIRSNDTPLPDNSDMIKIYPGPKHAVIEVKASKRPVGLFESEFEFRSVELQLYKGDIFYLFSDGYADQFGGDKGKKMKTSNFRETLLKICHLPMTDQQLKLEQHLAEWQNNFDQLDDITVLGVKVH